jgi:hypothetical protein
MTEGFCLEAFRVEISQAVLDAERRQAMSYSISTLLTRNLQDVSGENDPASARGHRRDLHRRLRVYEPKGVYRGGDKIDRGAGAINATHPDFRYQPIAGPEELGNGGRIKAPAPVAPTYPQSCPSGPPAISALAKSGG